MTGIERKGGSTPTIVLPDALPEEGPWVARAFDSPCHLSTQPRFAALDAHEGKRLADGCSVHECGRGATMLRVRAPSGGFHAVIHGRVEPFALAPTAQQKVIELVGPGQRFAEALVFTNRPYLGDAQTQACSQVHSARLEPAPRLHRRGAKLSGFVVA